MSTREEDPISPSSVAAHVLVLIILLIGGCVIELIKHRWEPPLVTNALLSLGEASMFLYMIGAIGKAFWWMIEQWTGRKPIPKKEGKELLRQFLPTKVEIGNVFKLGPIVRGVLTVILALLAVLLVFELFYSRKPNSNLMSYPGNKGSNGELLSLDIRRASWWPVLLTFFNQYSLSILLLFTALGGLTLIGFVSVLFLQRHKTRVGQVSH
jgi:hypothetical protein